MSKFNFESQNLIVSENDILKRFVTCDVVMEKYVASHTTVVIQIYVGQYH